MSWRDNFVYKEMVVMQRMCYQLSFCYIYIYIYKKVFRVQRLYYFQIFRIYLIFSAGHVKCNCSKFFLHGEEDWGRKKPTRLKRSCHMHITWLTHTLTLWSSHFSKQHVFRKWGIFHSDRSVFTSLLHFLFLCCKSRVCFLLIWHHTLFVLIIAEQ